MPRFPDFFILGAPKCGTTSMFAWLQQHPDTYLPVKEPNFLSRDILDTSGEAGAAQNEAEWLERLCPPAALGKVTGESTPKYLYSDHALARLSREVGNVRLIVMLRNSVDLAIAMHAQNCRQGREMEPNFQKAWARGPLRPGDRMTDYRFWAKPGERLKLYFQAFPAQDIHVIILEEDMRSNPRAAHSAALEHLRLSGHVLEDYSAQNERKTYGSLFLQGASRRMRRFAYSALGKSGLRFESGTGLLRIFDHFNQKGGQVTKLSDRHRKQIANELHDDAKLIASLLGRANLPWPDFDWTQVQHTHKAGSDSATDEGQPL